MQQFNEKLTSMLVKPLRTLGDQKSKHSYETRTSSLTPGEPELCTCLYIDEIIS